MRHHRQIVEMCGFLTLWCHNLVFAVVGEVVAPLVITSNRGSETGGKAGLINAWCHNFVFPVCGEVVAPRMVSISQGRGGDRHSTEIRVW